MRSDAPAQDSDGSGAARRWRSFRPGALLRRPGFSITVAVIVVAALIAAARARGPVVSTAIASTADIEQHVVASGRVRVVTRIQLSAQIAGRVERVRVVEGRRVTSGELLLQLEDAEARAAVAQAKAAVNQAAGRVEQLRKVGAVVTSEASRQASTNLSRAESELARVEALAAAGAVAQADVDDARRNVELARAQKSAADVQQTASAPRGIDSSIAMDALVESQARLAGATARLAQTRVVAPQDGIILSRAVEPGATVRAGDTLFEMAADGDTQLAIEPDERNLAWIRLGQTARASADAYPHVIFDAEVDYIAPSIDPQRGSVEVRLRVPEPPPFLRPDMTVSVDLTVASKSGVLAVPSDAVRGAATPTPWVAVVENGRVARQDVTLGIRGDGSTEIVSGLDEGAEVVLSTDVTLAEGQRVRAGRGDR
jgi:HlyD family secretion protein